MTTLKYFVVVAFFICFGFVEICSSLSINLTNPLRYLLNTYCETDKDGKVSYITDEGYKPCPYSTEPWLMTCTEDNKWKCRCCVKVDGGWSAWTVYSTCSSTCGDSVKSRYRACDSPIPSGNGSLCQDSRSRQTMAEQEVINCKVPKCYTGTKPIVMILVCLGIIVIAIIVILVIRLKYKKLYSQRGGATTVETPIPDGIQLPDNYPELQTIDTREDAPTNEQQLITPNGG